MAKKKTSRSVRGKSSKSFALKLDWKVYATGLGMLFLYLSYQTIFATNVTFSPVKYYYFCKKDLSIHDLADSLKEKGIIESSFSLRCMAELRGVSKVKKGFYEIKRGWNNFSLISQLKKTPDNGFIGVKVPSYKLRKNVVERVAEKFPEINKAEIWSLLRDQSFLDSIGFSRENVFCLFIPGKYYFHKSMTAREFLEAMHIEYQFFWNKDRMKRAKKLKLKPEEVMVLASIVYSETKVKEEMPTIAGVYYNRLQKEMRLQSDPTVIYASHKFGARRVYFADRKINSKYNTYRYYGLPPGPIYINPSYVIDAVLDCEDHDYLYFCAKDDLSGCHLFSETFDDHKQNAERYRRALDKAGIF